MTHRTQKQHYLTIDTVSYPSAGPHTDGVLQRMTLKILFDALASSHPRHQPSPSHQHITLLSLDLTSFSDSSLVACIPNEQLPLKAVYKGTILGLRYLHVPDDQRSKGPLAQTEFKRVQVKFTSVEERDRFIQTVKSVVPIKLAEGAKEEERQLPSPKKSRRSKESDSAIEESPRAVAGSKQSVPTKQVEDRKELAAPKPAPARSTTSGRQPLPPSISALLPSLASALAPPPSAPEEATSLELAKMDDETFTELFAEVLDEEGFPALVERVQGHLNSLAGSEQ